MRKMTDQHKKSLDRAILIMQMHADRQNVPKYKKEFVHDLEHLNEIAELVESHIRAPMFDHIRDAICELSV